MCLRNSKHFILNYRFISDFNIYCNIRTTRVPSQPENSGASSDESPRVPSLVHITFLFLGANKTLHRHEEWTTGRSNSYPEVHCSCIILLLNSTFLLKRWHFLLNSDIWKYKTNILHFFWNIWFRKQVTDRDISGFIGFWRNIIQIAICSQVLTPFFLYIGKWMKKQRYELFKTTAQKLFRSLVFYV